MLDTLRKGAKSWVAQFLLVLLVASFAVWGISGSILNAGGSAVVTVGDTEVSPNEFRLAYDRQMAAVGQQLGTRLTQEQARAFGIENQVYSQLIAGALLDEQAREMNLGLSDSRLAALIAQDAAFHDFNSRFDRSIFRRVLNSVGMSEEDYIRSRSQVAVRTQIVEAVAEGFDAPDAMISALAQYEAETRDVNYLLLTKANIDPVPAPSDDELSAFFESNKTRYAAPEYRKFTYVKLESEDIADPAAISDEMARADYEARKNRYTTAETRTIDQLVFADREAAEAAEAELASGKSFDTLITDQGRTAADVRLGSFTEETVPDQSLADAAFAITDAGGVSPVVDGQFGPVILRVAEITPESSRSFEEVQTEIRDELALAEAAQVLLDVHDAYEDARAGGMTLMEAATQQKLTPVTIEAADRSGQTPDGTVLSELPQSQQLLRDVFETEPGVEAPPISLGVEGFVWFEVEDVTPARDRTLDEVREQVVADWSSEQELEALGAKATALQERLERGADLSAIAAELSIAVETKFSLNRTDTDPVFGEAAVAAAFSGPQGLVTVANDTSGDNKILIQVTSVNDASGTTADSVSQEQRDQISQQIADDILDQVVAQLQAEYGVSVNRELAERALAF
ncbi:Parvulin-like peptidyl-prolyl isomerase [Hoeflea phototrophica DFL-43]|uniref:Parvulin-like PPIase n=1 Tax=Hoeflea phototrophica (strain DSM 17068 / NCIMB 14078 / DFL-43) TaxID=411684 RepID=A9D8P0_HOEPD|nr:peptidylprolyl isomerase [Hoeflea phototrophica]EDQ32765.2 Parvulin-like peptidyl-prolyl isomerase [Hoeflea phototrophica DFL-43]